MSAAQSGTVSSKRCTGGTGHPYLVHWTDTEHRVLTYPGPDAHVITSEQLRAQEDIAAAHFSSKHYRPSQRSSESAGG